MILRISSRASGWYATRRIASRLVRRRQPHELPAGAARPQGSPSWRKYLEIDPSVILEDFLERRASDLRAGQLLRLNWRRTEFNGPASAAGRERSSGANQHGREIARLRIEENPVQRTLPDPA